MKPVVSFTQTLSLKITPIKGTYSRQQRGCNLGHEIPFQPTSDKLVVANEMGSFFVETIDAIHVKLDRLADCLHDSHFDYVKMLPTRTLDSFSL